VKRALIYIICTCIAVLASLASIHLQEKMDNYATVQQPAVSSSTVSPIPAAIPKEHANREFPSAFPARVAFISNGQLMLLDGYQAGTPPVPVTSNDHFRATAPSFSHDGRWLAYLRYPADQQYADEDHLWVARTDGSGAYQVDDAPVNGAPSWSPAGDTIAYSEISGGNNPVSLKVAMVGTGKATIIDLHAQDILDYEWAPDGRSLAVSFYNPRMANQPLYIDQIALDGKRSRLLTLPNSDPTAVSLACGAADGLSWSPDGRYLAYFLYPFSGSVAADAAAIRLLDLQHPATSRGLGTGLIYKDWFAWSPDGRELAFITGDGREATHHKRLSVIDVSSGRIRDLGSEGEVDTQPLWDRRQPGSLLFCRGPAIDYQNGDGVLVPGQRIWLRTADGSCSPITTGSSGTQDCTPILSPDGQDLFFLRLDSRESGSLIMKPLPAGQEVELVRNLDVDPEFYGNYLPASVSICWQN
jgi:Tol biopolymer transport system component